MAADLRAGPLTASARPSRRPGGRSSVAVIAVVAAMAVALIVGLTGADAPAHASSPSRSAATSNPSRPSTQPSTGTPVPTAASSAPTTATPATTTPAPATTTPVAAGQSVVVPSVASMVAQVEAAGIVPGPSWSWSMGDPSTVCGRIDGAGSSATGCTSWASGVETTVFSGSPSFALVAHEVANAETEYSALPGLVSQVEAVAGSTSWSPTDAVASCLVEHFMGFQDDAAGSWQCPSALATQVADHIHDTVTTTRTTAVCGTASGVTSTLTFTAGAGALSVLTPAGATPVTAPAGTPVTVSGIGTFIATDQGGTTTVTGACAA